jgi:hypothetical protein
MAQVRLDERFVSRREIRTLSDRAFRLHVSAICWSAEYQTAGVIPRQGLRIIANVRGPRTAAEELVTAELWERLSDDAYRIKPGCFSIDRDPRYGAGQRERIYKRDGHRCVRCGATEDLTLDHIHPRSLAGNDSDDNLRTLCRSCNSSKGARV